MVFYSSAYSCRILPVLLLAALAILTPAQAQTPVKARKVSDFLSSLGVCTHMAQGIDAPLKSAACLKYVGIHNLRDDGSLAHVPDWITVYQQTGARICLLTNSNIADTLTMAKQLKAAGALLAVEGPNEPNNFPVTYEGKSSAYDVTALPVARFQSDLYKAVKSEPSLKGIPVFHSSEAGGSEKDNAGLQYLTIPSSAGTLMPDGTVLADYANVHNYVCGHTGKLVDNMAWNATDPMLNGDWDGMVGEYGKTWHSGFSGYTNNQLLHLPKVCTETGWTTQGDKSISPEQQGRLFLNLYLDAFKQGWAYTFIYMLRDDPIQGYWGLFDTDYKPKTSGVYLHNLTTILADRGSSSKPGTLGYSLLDPPATIHDLLLQKSDGTFDLAVWDEQVSGTSTVRVNLGRTYKQIAVYDPTTGTLPVQSRKNIKFLTLTLSDHPLIIAL